MRKVFLSFLAAALTPGSLLAALPDPVLHLRFDGSLQDGSGRGNHAASDQTPRYTVGKFGRALRLDATSSARLGDVANGAPADLRFGADTDFTISFWVQATPGWSSDPALVSNKNWNNGGNPGWAIAAEPGGNDWQWNFKGDATASRRDFDPNNANIAGAVWHLVTVVHDRDGLATFYHDGTSIGSVSIAGDGNADTALPIRIGRDGANGNAWTGSAAIDDLRIWRQTLTADQVQELAQQQQGPGQGAFGNRHALVIGIDGVRADVLRGMVQTGQAPNLANIAAAGTTTWNAFAGGELGTPTQQPTISGPGWMSILTGTWIDRHQVSDNNFNPRDLGVTPHFYTRLHQVRPGAVLSSIINWNPIDSIIVAESADSADYRRDTATDADIATQTVAHLGSANPDVVFLHFDDVDHAGHAHGYASNVPEYVASIAGVDGYIGQILDALEARPNFAQEDWLILVTTDHGGLGQGHGGQSAAERTIPLIVAGGEIPAGVVTDQSIGHACVPATVVRHLGLSIPAGWNWASDGFVNGASLRAAATADSIALQWNLPAGATTGLTGFELRRNGALIATLGAEARQFLDTSPGAAGTELNYELSPLGTGENPLTTRALGPGAVTLPDPVLHLGFDNSLSDSSGRNNHAVAEGTASYTPGLFGQALVLDATSSARLGDVANGAPADLRFGADTDFTLSFWLKASPWANDPAVISNKNWNSGANPGWIIAAGAGNDDWQWNFKGANGARRDFDPGNAPIADGQWHLITVSHDRDGLATFYHDGTSIGSVSIAGDGNADTALPIRIGRDGANGNAWTGSAAIDELKVWRSTLNAAQVAALAEAGQPQTAYQRWIALRRELGDFPAGANAPADDADGDGFANLAEFAAGSDPFVAASQPVFEHSLTEDGKLRVRFAQRNGGTGLHGGGASYTAQGLRYRLQIGTSLTGPWLAPEASGLQIAQGTEVGPDGTHFVVVELEPPASPFFCRLKVEFATP